MRLIHYVFAVLRLMTPFMAIVRLLIASVYAGATIAGIHAVAAITFALLMTVLTSEQSRGQSAENTAATPRIPPASKVIALHVFMIFFIVFPSFLVNAGRQIRPSRKSGRDAGYPFQNSILSRYRRFEDYGSAMLGGKTNCPGARYALGRFQNVFDAADGNDDPVGAVV
jgi:hypothetical protein